MPTVDRPAVVRAWLAARWNGSRLKSTADVQARQARLWRAMAPVVARTPAIAHLAGHPLADFPVVSPQQVRADFQQWNTLGLDRATAEAAARDAETGGPGKVALGVAAGFSSGSSGPPGIFLNNRAERAAYLGHLIARLLPKSAMVRRKRVALCLRARASLYSDVTGAGRFRFLFIDLASPGEDKLAKLEAFRPHVFIAPPHVLADMARRVEDGAAWPPARLFWGAEPMGELERDWIDAVLESRPAPIYQATEGFIGAPCRDGTLHLNEDVLIVEREPVPGTNRFVPIITDLRRTTQPMIRMRLPDLLEILPNQCSCGSPLTAIWPVEGRLEDLWRWGDVAIPPRAVDEAVSGALGPEEEWRAVASPSGVVVEAAADLMDEAVLAVKDLLRERGVTVPVTAGGRPPPIVVKRRRVRWIDG
ncbi:cell division protein FtsA [Brevundimonas lenta]|uniref:Putative adenylate-forming enzyme n=1 Tax=Brevundimonas lenta TaxID=424796 RepID=A0A7W6NNK2_9CAUL|nr:cell division protein FtsA [Brevundimonas lenta]MBB4082440.1 putative adenylate-forming enzyme [Brevundimonas lenta]